MKKAFVAAALLGSVLGAPAWADPIPGLFNTGVGPGGATLADGSADLHYTVNGGPAVVYTNPAYLTAPDARFISVQADGGYATTPNNFELTFDLTGYRASTATLSGLFGADNYGRVFLNGNLLAAQPAATIYENFQSLTSFSASSDFFINGVNTLRFEVTDTGPPSALIVSGLTGTVAAVPEPATWGLMIVGFGVVGGAMRRRAKVRTAVSFA